MMNAVYSFSVWCKQDILLCQRHFLANVNAKLWLHMHMRKAATVDAASDMIT